MMPKDKVIIALMYHLITLSPYVITALTDLRVSWNMQILTSIKPQTIALVRLLYTEQSLQHCTHNLAWLNARVKIMSINPTTSPSANPRLLTTEIRTCFTDNTHFTNDDINTLWILTFFPVWCKSTPRPTPKIYGVALCNGNVYNKLPVL